MILIALSTILSAVVINLNKHKNTEIVLPKCLQTVGQ